METQQPPTEDVERKPEPSKRKARKPRRRRRLWRRVVLILVAVLLLFVIFLPQLLSTGPGTSLLLSLVNKGIQGRAEVKDLSLSWFGSIRIRGLRLLDKTGREVVNVNSVAVKMGVWRAIKTPEHFVEATLESPRISLYEREDRDFSLTQAVQPRKEKPKEKAAAEKEKEKSSRSARGKITLRNGSVRVVRLDKEELTVRDINADLDMKSVGDIAGKLQLSLAEGGRAELDIDLRNKGKKGQFSPSAMAGRIAVRTPEEVELGQVMAMTSPDSKTAGRLKLDMQVNFQPGKASVQFDNSVKELSAQGLGKAEVRPLDLASKGKLDLSFSEDGLQGIVGDTSVSGEGVQLATNLDYQPSRGKDAPAFDGLTAVMLEGKEINLPEMSLRANGQVDLGRLAQAIPALMNLGEDLRLTGGKVLVDRLSINGGSKPRAEGSIRATDLSAIRTDPKTKQEKAIEWEAANAVFDASIAEGEGLLVKMVKVESDLVTLNGRGTPKKMNVDLSADLSELPDQAGKIELTAVMETRDSVLSFQGSGKATDLSITTEDNQFTTAEATLAVRGSYHTEEKKFSSQIEITGKDSLANLPGEKKQPEKLRLGPIEIKLAMAKDSPDSPLVSTGQATVENAAFNEEALFDKTLDLRWSDMKFSTKDSSLTAAEITLDSPDLIRLSAKDTNAQFGEKPQVEGEFEVSGDLAKSLTAVRPLAGWEKPPAIAGQLSWKGRAATAESRITASGTATVDDLEVGSGERPLRQGTVQFEHGTVIDLDKDLFTLDKFSLDSRPLTLSLSGKIEKLKTDRILDLSGHYKGSWENLMALINELSPKLNAQAAIDFAGTTESDLRITGPANRPKVEPVFRGVSTNRVRLNWTSGRVAGLQLGPPVNLQPAMADGRLILKGIKIPASGGNLNINGAISFTDQGPTLHIEDKTELIDKVRITPEVGRLLLSRINPIFGQLASLEGVISLSLSNVDFPLSNKLLTAGAGSGHLDMTNLSLKPEGILALLVEMSGAATEGGRKVELSGLDFAIRNGKISYDNFTLKFGEDFDLRFRGSVGFNDALELWVSLPVGKALLRRYGVGGPLDDYVRLLAADNVRVEIPIRGKRLSPTLGKVNLTPLIEKVSERLLREGIEKGLGDFLKKPGAEGTKLPDLKNIEKPEDLPIGPLLDLLRKQGEDAGKVKQPQNR